MKKRTEVLGSSVHSELYRVVRVEITRRVRTRVVNTCMEAQHMEDIHARGRPHNSAVLKNSDTLPKIALSSIYFRIDKFTRLSTMSYDVVISRRCENAQNRNSPLWKKTPLLRPYKFLETPSLRKKTRFTGGTPPYVRLPPIRGGDILLR